MPSDDAVNATLSLLQNEYPMWCLRQYRNQMLTKTDPLVQTPDITVHGKSINAQQVAAVVAYRALLRTLPDNITDLSTIDMSNMANNFPPYPV